MTYLDANATETLRPEARAAVLAALDLGGNPSSVHAAGRAARRLLEEARETIAARFGGRPADLVFTSGGTEADAMAVHALGAGRRLIVGATEHDAVRSAAAGAAVLPVDGAGVADLDALAALLAEGGGAGLPDAGQQRDRHAAAGGRGGAAVPGGRARCCMWMRCRQPAGPASISPPWGRTAWRCRRTSWAGRRARARCCWRRRCRRGWRR